MGTVTPISTYRVYLQNDLLTMRLIDSQYASWAADQFVTDLLTSSGQFTKMMTVVVIDDEVELARVFEVRPYLMCDVTEIEDLP